MKENYILSGLPYYLLDVFTTQKLQGNPLAIFPEPGTLTTEQMQALAQELNLSETVFFTDASDDSFARLRIFSPSKELNFAGHPTIGSAFLLHRLRGASNRFSLQENVGPVAVEMEDTIDGPRFWLTVPPIVFAETLSKDVCAKLLGLGDDAFADAPPQFVSAGSPMLFIQLRSTAAVDRAVLNHSVLPHALGSLNSGGTFVFAMKDDSVDVYSRMFGPQIGISEDPATGGATGPLAAYMIRYGLVGPDAQFTSEQGVKMGRRSLLHVRMSNESGVQRIQVGGHAVIVGQGTFERL